MEDNSQTTQVFDEVKELDNYYRHSSKLSESLRNIAYAIIATDFALLTTKADFFKSDFSTVKIWLILSLLISIVGLFFDYLNSLFGFFNSGYKYEHEINSGDYGNHYYYVFGHLFFVLKQITIVIGALTLVICIWYYI